MSEHTKGRLSVEYQGFEYGYDLDTEDRATLAEGLSEANARRLAAAWNFCEDMKTETMEQAKKTAFAYMTDADQHTHKLTQELAAARALIQQQDALLGNKACATKECRELLAARSDLEKARKRDEEWHDHTTRKASELAEALVDRDTARALLREVRLLIDENSEECNARGLKAYEHPIHDRIRNYLDACDTLEGAPNAG